jgi:hypothetical protein
VNQGRVLAYADGSSGNCAPDTDVLNHLHMGYPEITLTGAEITFSFVPTLQLSVFSRFTTQV